MTKASLYSIVALTLTSILSVSVSYAAVYKWVDENGKVHFSDKPSKKSKSKSEVVDIKPEANFTSSSNLPSVARRQPIKNILESDVKSVVLEHLSVDFKGSTEDEKLLGKTYKFTREAASKVGRLRQSDNALPSALPCLAVGNLTLNNANYIVRKVDFHEPFNKVFEDNDYKVPSSKTFARQENSAVDLSLAASVTDIRLTHCGSRSAPDLHTFTQNSTYLKIEWTVFDNLARQVVFKTITEGADYSFRKAPKYNGATISASLAFRQATEHLLAQQEFIDILKVNTSLNANFFDTGNSIKDINIVYGNSKSKFISRTGEIEKAAVTIRTANGHGSGFVVSAPGYILTNHHVIAGSKQVIVIMDGKEHSAVVMRSSPGRDVALLKLQENSNVRPMHINTGAVSLGEEIYVVGTPLDEQLDFSISRGIISARRQLDKRNYYQTDAAVNPGNSGGPVFNSAGDVIGITVSGLFTKDGSSLNINYVIPILDAFDALQIETK